MKLADLMRKSVSVSVATATPATFATQSTESTESTVTVAKVATVAVANPTEAQSATLNPADEVRVRAWLAHIDETDPVMIEETLRRCASDAETLSYFLWRAQEVPTNQQ